MCVSCVSSDCTLLVCSMCLSNIFLVSTTPVCFMCPVQRLSLSYVSTTFVCFVCHCNICVHSLYNACVLPMPLQHLSFICLYNFCVFHVFQQLLCVPFVSAFVCVMYVQHFCPSCVYNVRVLHVSTTFIRNVFRSHKCLRLTV
jgi:hypothetical protein